MSIFKRKNISKPAPREAAKPKPVKEAAPMAAKEKDQDLATEHRTAVEDLNRAAVHVSDSIRNAIDRMKNAGAPAKGDVSTMASVTKALRSALEDINDLAPKDAKKKKADEE